MPSVPWRATVADVSAMKEWVPEVWKWHEGVQVLVHSAGITNRSGPLEVQPEEWDRVFDVNVRGLFFLTQAIGKHMLEGEGGSVVSIASLSGVVSDGAQAAYSASKRRLSG